MLTESPANCSRTTDTLTYLVKPLSEHYEVSHFSVLESDPKNNKQATKTEIKHARADVLAEIEGYNYIILVGNTPLQTITEKAGISRVRGKPIEQDGVIYFPMNNPSIFWHDENQRVIFERDVEMFHQIVEYGGIPEEKALDIRLVLSWDDVNDLIDDLTGAVSCDIETNSLNPWQKYNNKNEYEPAKIVSIGFGTKNHQWILPVNHESSPWKKEDILEILELVVIGFNDCFTIFQNGKFDVLWIWVHYGIKLRIDFDTMLAHYILDENDRHGLKHLAQKYCGAPDWDIAKNEKQGNVAFSVLAKYQAHDLYYTRKLRFIFGKMLQQDFEIKRVFHKILMPCANLFVEIEYDGIFINMNQFEEAESVLRESYSDALKQLKQWEPEFYYDSRGRPQQFNWGSTTQLGWLLYEKLGIPVIERTKTGTPSCNESVIKRIDHPCTEALLKFRAARQQLSFFIDGWKPYLHERHDGTYLHPSFKLHGTVTGRLSCENPNMQQIPRDKRIRSLISAPKGWTLIECDLSQIELRIAAELANEQEMLFAFINDIDIHWLTALNEISRGGGLKNLVINTAKKIEKEKINYSKAIDTLLKAGPDRCAEINPEWKEYRKKAKAINFGYIYGMWWRKFMIYARDNYGVTVTEDQAQESRRSFFQRYASLEPWHRRQRNFVRKTGYVRSLSGRKRRLPAARQFEDSPERREAERQAINSPVQSFANDINLMAALQLRQEYPRRIVQICGTVHDAILVRVKNKYVKEVYLRLLEIMKSPKLFDDLDIELFVPIEGDSSIGPWGDGVSLEKWESKR